MRSQILRKFLDSGTNLFENTYGQRSKVVRSCRSSADLLQLFVQGNRQQKRSCPLNASATTGWK